MWRGRTIVRRAIAGLGWLGALGTWHRVASAQARADIIDGVLVDSLAHPVSNAVVYATRAPDRQTQVDTVGSSGTFHFAFARSVGEYLLVVTADGFRDHRERIFVSDTGSCCRRLIVHLQPTVTIAAVRIVARPVRPPRREGIVGEVGSDEDFVSGVNAILPPGREGDLIAMAGSLPGFVLTGSGVSTLGLDASQNGTTLNGLTMTGSVLPRDLKTVTRVTSTSYDPARGGFSGAQTAVDMTPGTNYSSRRGSAAVTAPTSERFTAGRGDVRWPSGQFLISGGTDGALIYDRFFYNVAAQLSRSVPNVIGLDDTRAAGPLLGVDRPVLDRLLEDANQMGIPLGLHVAPPRVDEASLGGRVDYSQSTDAAIGASALVHMRNANGEAVQPFAVSLSGSTVSDLSATLQAFSTRYVRNRVLNDFRTALTLSNYTRRPLASFPRVLVDNFSGVDYGQPALTYSLGGSLQRPSRRRASSAEIIDELSRSVTRTVRLKATAGVRIGQTTLSALGADPGSFVFSSIQSFENNIPATFTRAVQLFGESERRNESFAALSASAGIGTDLQWTVGARADLQHVSVLGGPSSATALERGVPQATNVELSPRLGFTKRFSKRRPFPTMRTNTMGTFIDVPTGVIRGGVGRFVGQLPGAGRDQLGAENLTCFGLTSPTPEWSAYTTNPASSPHACNADGGERDLETARPLYAEHVQPPASWRASLGFTNAKGPFNFGVEGMASWNLSQTMLVDQNVSSQPKFREGIDARPVFVNPESIDQATGAIISPDWRLDPTYAQVLKYTSNQRSFSDRVTVTASLMPTILQRGSLSASYSLAHAAGKLGGEDVPSFGRIVDLVGAPLPLDYRHQIVVQAGWMFSNGVTASLFANAISGSPYTPVIAGDANGDGIAFDRAFIFAPSSFGRVGDSAAYQHLLQTVPRQARRCLETQFGHQAALNGCRTPWSVRTNMTVGKMVHIGVLPSMNVSLSVANPIALVDRLVHDGKERGWADVPNVDPVLFAIRGFDAASKQFLYVPNAQFGHDRRGFESQTSGLRMTLDFRIDFSTPVDAQTLERFLSPGRGRTPGPRLSRETLKMRYARLVPGIYRQILQQSDSLLITQSQAEALVEAEKPYVIQLDSVWTALSEYLTSLDDAYDAPEALRQVDKATDLAWSLSQAQAPIIKRILVPVQIQMLPLIPRLLITATEPVSIRIRQY